jgi:hypothetical protein
MSELLKIFIANLASNEDSATEFDIVFTAENRDEAVAVANAYASDKNFFIQDCYDTGEESNRPFLRLLDIDEDM